MDWGWNPVEIKQKTWNSIVRESKTGIVGIFGM